METKDTLSLCSNSEAQQMQQIQDKAKKSCMVSFRQLHSHLKRLLQNDLQGSRKESRFKRAFVTLSGQDTETFTGTMFLNVEQLEKQLDKEDFQEIGPMAAFNVLETQFQMFIMNCDYLNDEYSIDERVQLKREYDSWVNERQMQTIKEKVDTSQALDASSVDTESSRIESKEQDTSSRSGNDEHNDVADIRPIYDEEPMVEKSNEAKVKHDIDVTETINIELEHKVAKLLKKNKSLKNNYKELFDSIKITRAKTTEHTTSLIVSNDKFIAQLQEKGFAIAALKNELRKSTGNSVNTKFAKSSILGKPMSQPLRNQPVVRQPTAFKSELPRFSKHWYDFQVDVHNDLSTPVTTHYLPKEREAAYVKPHHMIASSNSRISLKNMPRFTSNDMVHNHYLKKAKKRTQEQSRNLEPSLIPSARLQSTDNGSKPMPRRNTQTSRIWPATKNSFVMTKIVPIAEHLRNSRNDSYYDNPDPVPQRQDVYSLADADVPSQQELDMLFGPLYDAFFNTGSNPSTNVQSTSAPSTHTNVHAEENNNDQAEKGEHVPDDEFTNPFCASTQEVAESSSHNIDPEMCMYALTVSTTEPKNIKEAMADSGWIEAMQEELHQFDKLLVWELVDKPFGKSIIKLKWLWKNKKDKDQTMDVKTTFLNGSLKEEVYVAQPDGFVDPYHLENVYRLRKALYGLKQAPRAWYDELSTFLTSKSFTKGTIDPTLFTIRYEEDILLVQIYVDDIIFDSTNPKYSKRFEKLMHSRFEMSLMREMKFFLGLQIHQSTSGIFINQAKYTLEILHKHGMDKGQSIGTPIAMKDVDLSGNPVDQTDYRRKIGSLMYLISSRPDIVQAVCFCARYQSRPTEKHLKEVKRIFRYLRGDKLVSWMSKKQNYTAMSSAEAEYVVLSSSCAQVMWMRTQLQDYGFNYNKIPLYCDSQSAIAISCNPVQHSRTKHIHTRYYFIKEQVENGIIELYFFRTEYQLADMFTKALPEDSFKYLVRRIGMRCLTLAELEVLAKEAA
nr:hypothetical protein [Tanacetum cinerariifolium]